MLFSVFCRSKLKEKYILFIYFIHVFKNCYFCDIYHNFPVCFWLRLAEVRLTCNIYIVVFYDLNHIT